MIIMDRNELRFRILFLYYQELHSDDASRDVRPREKIKDIGVENYELRAAEAWLIDSYYVNGEVNGALGTTDVMPFISRINSAGVNYVESIMNTALTEISESIPELKTMDKTEKIKKFAQECVNNPVTHKMCDITLKIITDFMFKNQA